jgi:hypothetical protein
MASLAVVFVELFDGGRGGGVLMDGSSDCSGEGIVG